jgi:GT2 family glycosyltransferase
MSRFKQVSVIIPTLNHPAIADAVRSVLRNTTDVPFEVIVVGRDEPRRVPSDPRVRFVDTGAPVLPSAGRNRGADEAAGDLLLFTDSDCVADASWIRNAILAVDAERHVIGGGIRFPEDNLWDLGDNIAIFHGVHVSCRPRVTKSYLGSNNLAITREAFRKVGGFNPELWVGEDWDLLNRLRAAGFAVHFDPDCAVLHNSGRTSRQSVIEHARSYGDGYVKLMKQGVIPIGRGRVDGLAKFPPLAALWSALRATWQTARIFSAPALWRYLRAAPVVWLFHYERRREIFRKVAVEERPTSNAQRPTPREF